MAQSGHVPPESEGRRQAGPVTAYIEACRELKPGPLDRREVAHLTVQRRAARRAVGQAIKRT